MEFVKIKLDEIMYIWENYILNYQFFQKQIKFTDDVKSNYFADIIVYLTDTLPLITTYLKKKNSDKFHEQILNTTGLLQTIYVHQDLIVEMLHIFNLPESPLKDKNPNRRIRNELVGHPINYEFVQNSLSEKKVKQLKSSIFLKKSLSISTIHYLKYSRENNFSPEEFVYSTKDIIQRHNEFLNKYLDQILSKLKRNLESFSSEIENIKNIVNQKDFNELIELIDLKYEYFFSRDGIYNQTNISEINKKKDKHPRYKFSIDLFKKELIESIKLERKDITRICQKKKAIH